MFDQIAPARLIEIDERTCGGSDALHERIAAELAFPAYYGRNLSALSDCLEDLDTPTQIIVQRTTEPERKPWLDGFCKVLARCSRENPYLDVIIEEPHVSQVTLDDVLARLELIDRRLDAIQDAAAPSEPPVQAATTRVAADTCRNTASGSDGDRFECGDCGCRVSDYLEDTRMLIDGLRYCPNCGREVTNPEGSNALGWVGELI